MTSGYYYAYDRMSNITLGTGGYVGWNSSLSQNPDDVIEFVTHPNNPDGVLRQEYYGNNMTIYDLVYYWPSLTPNMPTYKLNKSVMIFSFTKFSGHAGSRFGWALVKDPQVASAMRVYMSFSSMGVSVDTQLRALYIISVMNYNNGTILNEFFCYVSTIMASRWERLQTVFANQTQFLLESVSGTAYAWIKCPGFPSSCNQLFLDNRITGKDGSSFGTPGYFRINLTIHDKEFELILQYLRNILASVHKESS